MSKITYRNIPDETSEFIYIEEETLLGCVYEYARTSNDELYKLIMQQKVVLSLNDSVIHPDAWNITPIRKEDTIIIYPVLSGGDAGAIVQIVIGAALLAFAGPIGTVLAFGSITAATMTAVVAGIGVSLVLGGVSYLLFQPDLPQMRSSISSGNKSTQTYNWSGIKTAASNDMYVPIVYGTHKIGGNLISAFTEAEGEDNYLYMLIALCEGEIDGICSYHNHGSVCTTSDKSDASYVEPAIEINEQPLRVYDEVEWWYRTGTNDIDAAKDAYYPFAQNKIPYFTSARTQYDDGREITTDGTTYVTTREVDLARLQLYLPSLYDGTSGSIKTNSIDYKVEFKTDAEGSWHTASFTKYGPSVSASSGNSNNCSVEYEGDDYRTFKPQPYTITVLDNTFSNFTAGDNSNRVETKTYTIKVEIKNTTTGVSSIRNITNSIKRTITLSAVYDENSSWFGYPVSLIPSNVYDFGPITHTYSTIKVGEYVVELNHLVSPGNVFSLSSTSSGSSDWTTVNGKSKSGLWRSHTLDFDSIGSGRDIYNIKVIRRTEPSTDIEVSDTLILNSVTEIIDGDFIYPNTALLGLRIKATEQLSGAIPNITTIIRGKKISVPDTSGSEDFDDIFYDDTQSRFETSGGAERTWDESSYETEWSNNSILCLKDLTLNKRYGIGQYLSSSNFDDSSIVSAIKKCHIKYDPYSASAPDHLSWFDGGTNSNWGSYWNFVAGSGTSDASTRTITLGGNNNTYVFHLGLVSPLVSAGLYTFSITLNTSDAIDIYLDGYNERDNTLVNLIDSKAYSGGAGTSSTSNISIPISKINAVRLTLKKASSGTFSGSITDISLTGSTILDHYHTFDGVIESGQSALTVLLEMCNSFRCWPIWYNGTINYVLDQDDTPVHTLTEGNIIEDSFNQTFTPLSDIPYRLDGQFSDSALDYDLRSIVVNASTNSLEKSNRRSVGLKGIVTRQKAERELKFKVAKLINCTHIVNFKCGIDTIHATAGDVINIQQSLPNPAWGYGGRILSYDSTNASITLDATVPLTNSNATYVIKYQTADNSYTTATVNATGAIRTIPVVSWPSSNPKKDAVYAIGHKDTYTKSFRLLKTDRTEDNNVEVVGIEHVSGVYTEPTISILEDKHSVDTRNKTREPPINVSIETLNPYDGVGFTIKAESRLGDQIYIQMSDENDFSYDTIGIIKKGQNSLKYIDNSLILDHTYYFKIFSRSVTGVYSDPIYITHYMEKSNFVVPAPTGIRLKGVDPLSHSWDGRYVIISWNPVGSSGSVTDPVDGYVIKIYHTSRLETNLLRTAYTNNTDYLYTYDMNLEDNGGSNPKGSLIFVIYTRTRNGVLSKGSAQFDATNSSPSSPQSLSSEPWMKSMRFYWTDSGLSDLKYYLYRTKVEASGGTPSGDWSSWITTTDNSVQRNLSDTEQDTYGTGARIYIEVKVEDLYGNQSSASSANDTTLTLNVESSDIDDFAITASKIFTKIPIITGDTWSDDTPSPNYVSWNEHTLYYDGTEYTIASGNTNDKYIYWSNGDSVYSTSATNPVLSDGDFVISTNISGSHDLAWNAIANEVIGSAYIQTAGVATANIDDLAVTNAKINDLSAEKITAGYLSVDRIEAGSISLVSKASDFDLTSISGDLDDIDNGTNYGKILLTDISAGHILLSEAVGDLDDLSDGTTYGKVLSTEISSGKIVLVGSTASININNTTFGNAGIQLQYNSGSPRIYIGDGSNEYIKYISGTGISISTSTANGITIKSGGGIKIESGGDINIYSGGTDAKMVFHPSSGSNNFEIYATDYVIGSTYQRLYIKPDHSSSESEIWFGDSTDKVNDFYLYLINSFHIYTQSSHWWFTGTVFDPSSHKASDIGTAVSALDNMYSDDFNNVADLPFLDAKDDLDFLLKVQGSGIIDPQTGLEIVDDDTLPDFVKAVVKDGSREILLDPDGKPYFTLKAMSGWLMGCIKQLNKKYEQHIETYH